MALLPDGHTVAISGSPEVLEAMLEAAADSTPEMLSGSPAGRVAGSLMAPVSAAIEVGPDACGRYARASNEVDAALVEAVGPLTPWGAMGVATYATAGEPSAARLVFLLDGPETAVAEAEARARLASEGHSLLSGEIYTDVLFAVTGASATGSVARIDLAPVDDRSRSITRAWNARDLLPARCDLA